MFYKTQTKSVSKNQQLLYNLKKKKKAIYLKANKQLFVFLCTVCAANWVIPHTSFSTDFKELIVVSPINETSQWVPVYKIFPRMV